MNKQRKVLITITYNEMGIIINTKAEEVAQPDLQPTCNQLATDYISRQDAIDALSMYGDKLTLDNVAERIYGLPSAQSEIIRCKDCRYIDERHYEDEGEPPYIKYACANKAGLAKGYQVHEWDFCSRAARKDEQWMI